MKKYLKRIEETAADRKKGARELHQWAAENLLAWMKKRGRKHPQELIPLLAKTAKAQPSMAPMLNLVNQVLLAWEEGCLKAQKLLEKTIREEKNHTAKLVEEGMKIIQGRRLVTLSRSSTLLEVIKGILAQGKRAKILISEGRPLMGGVATAHLLHNIGAEVTLCTDGLIFSLVQRGDVIALGADAITPDFLVNRCGSYPLALVARDKSVPFYTFTDTGKLLPQELVSLFKIEDHHPDEVLEDAPFHIVNQYFDQTPLKYITAAVTEKGALTPNKLRDMIKTMKVSTRIREVIEEILR